MAQVDYYLDSNGITPRLYTIPYIDARQRKEIAENLPSILTLIAGREALTVLLPEYERTFRDSGLIIMHWHGFYAEYDSCDKPVEAFDYSLITGQRIINGKPVGPAVHLGQLGEYPKFAEHIRIDPEIARILDKEKARYKEERKTKPWL